MRPVESVSEVGPHHDTPQVNAASRLGWQLARLAMRFGEGRVGRVALADPEAPLPETRWTWHPVAADGSGSPGPAGSAA